MCAAAAPTQAVTKWSKRHTKTRLAEKMLQNVRTLCTRMPLGIHIVPIIHLCVPAIHVEMLRFYSHKRMNDY